MSITPRVSSPAQLSLQTTNPAAGIVHIAVAGEIDLNNTGELRAQLFDALRTRRPHHIAVDLAGVRFIDCGGLAVLILLSQAALSSGCCLEFTDPPAFLLRMLKETGTLSILTVHPTGPHA
ncbi:STAS domain-containing protein [Actinoplanes awajinensis]|uniref:Anti-sigma factor antagonist n=1 Tax=Actinoplanes awajinensis subsp. mycoplanecinus TaxID=135947 RepID=A0A0X3VD59_9ACTN|nr:STAS domain-containing protein [Actinoplanes awajinensis]KUL41256.1 hypothetical protein ADL15_05150 [Actinoplanes awajinensis subsp. mycoplanecinus]